MNLLFYTAAAYVHFKHTPSSHANETRQALAKMVEHVHHKAFDRLDTVRGLLERYYAEKKDAAFLQSHFAPNGINGIQIVEKDHIEPLTPNSGMPLGLPPGLIGNTAIPQLFTTAAAHDRLQMTWILDFPISKKSIKTHTVMFALYRSIIKRIHLTIPLNWVIYSYDISSKPTLIGSSYIDEKLQWLEGSIGLNNFKLPVNETVVTNLALPPFESVAPDGSTVLVIPIVINISSQIRQIAFYVTPAIYLQDDFRATAWMLLSVFLTISLMISGASYYFSRSTSTK